MQNLIPKFLQSSVISEKPGYFSKKLKTLPSSNYDKVEYFLLKFYARFLVNHVYKSVSVFFFIFLDLEFLIKIWKTWFLWVFRKQVFFIFANKTKTKTKFPNTLL